MYSFEASLKMITMNQTLPNLFKQIRDPEGLEGRTELLVGGGGRERRGLYSDPE